MGVSEDDDNATYLFDMEANPGERTDGDCAVFERCNNLLGHADYGSVHANLRSRFFDYLDTMVPSSVNFKYDGPLANPEYFNGSLGVPWRDENDVPYVTDDLTPYLTDSLRSSVHTINSPARNQQDVLAIDFDGHNIYNQDNNPSGTLTRAVPATQFMLFKMDFSRPMLLTWGTIGWLFAFNAVLTGTVVFLMRQMLKRRPGDYQPVC